MIDPSALVNNLVDLLRLIPDLVLEMGGDEESIFAYHDSFPRRVSLASAIHTMPVPGIMVAWQGTGPTSNGQFENWAHQITLYLRAKSENGEELAGYYKLFRLIVKGVPMGYAQPLMYLTVHESCYPMDVPTIQRQTDAEALDYFEIPLTFAEIADD